MVRRAVWKPKTGDGDRNSPGGGEGAAVSGRWSARPVGSVCLEQSICVFSAPVRSRGEGCGGVAGEAGGSGVVGAADQSEQGVGSWRAPLPQEAFDLDLNRIRNPRRDTSGTWQDLI